MHRVVSLLPAGTEIVSALGAGATLVGITHECDYPPTVAALPRVTSSAVDRDATSAAIDQQTSELSAGGLPVFALDAVQLAELRPTLILTQTLCEVCAVSEGDVRAIGDVVHPAPRIVSLGGRTLAGVWGDIRAVADALGESDASDALMAHLDARMRTVHETLKAARAPRPRVAVIEWLDPLYDAGHWTPELVKRAGGIDVLAEAGAHSKRISSADVRAADPELIVFAPCGFDVERATRESVALLATPEWAWARDRRCWAVDGNALTSRPGPRLVDAIETLAAMVAPALFAPAMAGYARQLSP